MYKFVNLRIKPINVEGIERQPNEIFEVSSPKSAEIRNLAREKFIQKVQDKEEKKDGKE